MEETSSSTGTCTDWDALPGDIFTVLLSRLDTSEDKEVLKNLRSVCRAWKQHVDSRLECLSIRISGDFATNQISKKFQNLRDIAAHAAFDISSQNHQFMHDLGNCQHLERLVLKNCKGKVMKGFEALHPCKHLKELSVDGDIFQTLRCQNLAWKQLEKLAVHNCSNFVLDDYHHLRHFSSIKSLLLTHVTPDWK